MRTRQEIQTALHLLDQYGGEHKDAQTDVLHNRMTESQVFDTYVSTAPGDERNEARFFAARDAAQYVSGRLTLEELIPDLPDGVWENLMRQKEEYEAEETTATVSLKDYRNLLKRVERLERRLGLRAEINKATRKDASEAPSDLISQAEACRLLGCGKSTIKRWADKGLVTGYLKGKRVCYSKHDLMHREVVKEYKLSKSENA